MNLHWTLSKQTRISNSYRWVKQSRRSAGESSVDNIIYHIDQSARQYTQGIPSFFVRFLTPKASACQPTAYVFAIASGHISRARSHPLRQQACGLHVSCWPRREDSLGRMWLCRETGAPGIGSLHGRSSQSHGRAT